MIRSPDCILFAPKICMGESSIFAPIDKSAALILQSKSLLLTLEKRSDSSGTRMMTLADLNSFII